MGLLTVNHKKEILKDQDDIQKLFYIESLKNNGDCVR